MSCFVLTLPRIHSREKCSGSVPDNSPHAVPDQFYVICKALRYHGFMKKCPICGRKVVSKRKDAIYCRNPRCRKAAYLAKKEQAASAPLPIGPNKASVVVSFPDGSRWLMELTPLQTMEKAQIPTLTQVSNPVDSISVDALPQPESEVKSQILASENGSERIVAAMAEPENAVENVERGATNLGLDEAAELIANGSEVIQKVVADEVSASEPSVPLRPEAVESPSLAPPAEVEAASAPIPADYAIVPASRFAELHSVELFFVDGRGRRIAFEHATFRRGGMWRIDPNARATLGFGPMEGRGLGGKPGRWREFYPKRAPVDLGFEPNLGVLCWQDERRWGYAPDEELLRAALGTNWRERLRQRATKRFGYG